MRLKHPVGRKNYRRARDETRIDALAIRHAGNSSLQALKSEGNRLHRSASPSVASTLTGFIPHSTTDADAGRQPIAVFPKTDFLGIFTTTETLSQELSSRRTRRPIWPDASNGVLTLSTKDPREYPGTILEAAGGVRNFFDIQGRQAGVIANGKLGYKITGEYQQAKDYSNKNIYAPAITGNPAVSPELNADWDTDVMRGSGALVYYLPATRS